MNNNENQKPDDLELNAEGDQVDKDQLVGEPEDNENENENENQDDENTTTSEESATTDAVNGQQQFAKNTLNESISRFGSTGQVRAMMFATAGFVLLAAGGAWWMSSGEEEQMQHGTVVLPSTSASASATVTAEQAAHIKAQQEKQAEEAAMRGETYIAAILTERQEVEKLEGNPTQPGLANKKEASTATPNGNISPSEMRFLQARGYDQQAVNTDQQGQRDLYGNTINNGAGAGTGAAGSNTPPNNFYQVQPLNVASSQDNSSTSGSGQVPSHLEKENAALDRATADVDKWQADYLALREKKAKAIDEKTQLAFESQIKNIASAKVDRKALASSNVYQNIRFKNDDVQYDQFGNPIAMSGVNGRLALNATAPQNPDINGNGYVQGHSSVDGSAAGKKALIRAGDTYRAILTTGVNTDEGTEVVAKLQSGPFKGATLLGNVNIMNENIQFRFTRLLQKGKDEIAIDAVARQLGTNKSGMADEIKKHYIQRYTALATASALSGYGEAYRQTAGTNATLSNGTVVTQSTEPSTDRIVGNVVGEMGNELSSEIQKTANRKPTYITNNGKVFNLFFNNTVYENSVSGSVSTTVNR